MTNIARRVTDGDLPVNAGRKFSLALSSDGEVAPRDSTEIEVTFSGEVRVKSIDFELGPWCWYVELLETSQFKCTPEDLQG